MIRRLHRHGLALWAGLALSACGGSKSASDSGPMAEDAGIVVDATAEDAGPRDATAPVDSGEDPGPADVGPADAGLADLGVPDAGQPALGPVTVDAEAARPPQQLSSFNFFRFSNGAFEYNARVVPYELNTPLFSDFALKARALWVPEGTAIEYRETGALEFPVGSAIIKTFMVADDLRSPQDSLRLVETRILLKASDGWKAYPYLWNEAQTDAEYFVRGQVEAISFIDPLGQNRTAQYLVPQKNQCLLCHEIKDDNGQRYTTLIGPRARYLNRQARLGGMAQNQLQYLADEGMLTGLPALTEVPQAFDWSSLDTTSTTTLDAAGLQRAARDYLDINCAHCHRPNATQGMTSRLWLNWDNEDTFHLGFCKEPGSAGSGAAGRQYDIVPGDAEASILIYRTETEMVGSMMPLLGRSLKHDVAAGVLRGWVDSLPPDDCGP